MLSFVVAGIGCAFAGMCYSELASMIPISGSAYTYTYASMGEFAACSVVQHAHEVDHRAGPANESLERRSVVDIGLEDVDGGQQNQVLRAFAPARRHDDAMA